MEFQVPRIRQPRHLALLPEDSGSTGRSGVLGLGAAPLRGGDADIPGFNIHMPVVFSTSWLLDMD